MKRRVEPAAGPRSIPRRQLFKRSAALLSAAGLSRLAPAAVARAAGSDATSAEDTGPTVIANNHTAVVSTVAGTVIGYQRLGIFTFKGIPYAASTEGANRFMPPAPPAPWRGVRSCRHWGPIAPQNTRGNGRHNDEEAFMFDWNDANSRVYAAGEGEDCLVLNVWSPGLGDGKKRPVMVWIHGGGFTNGSGNEQLAYDGENLARRGDVVIVTLNHRLGPLGFLDLSAYGDKYAQSANVGLLDLVAALQWVRDNATAFGGDAGCVTIFGQSGGGAKVSALMGMPAARGLFHRAIVQSGSMSRAASQHASRHYASLILAELGLDASNIDDIQTVPYADLLLASDRVSQKFARPRSNARPTTRSGAPSTNTSTSGGTIASTTRPAEEHLGFGPVLDGFTLPAHPFDPRASDLSAEVPLLVGSTLNEFTNGMNHPHVDEMTESELETRVRETFGEEKAPAILAAFAQAMPHSHPFDRWSRIATVPSRTGATEQCLAKAALGDAPVYLYWFTWQTPILDGRPGAFHCSEIPFVFDNTNRCDTMTGGGPDARTMAAATADAWLAFARNGNPNHAGLPTWKPFTQNARWTMKLDRTSACLNDPDGAENRSTLG